MSIPGLSKVEVELFTDVFENHGFKYYEFCDGFDLENYTNGGVNMIHTFLIEQQDSLKESIQMFVEQINNFDIGEEIDMLRECPEYCKKFTIEESVEDFKCYKEKLDSFKADLLKLMDIFEKGTLEE